MILSKWEVILSVLVFLALVVLVFIHFGLQEVVVQLINTVILAATCGVVCWYTKETQEIRKDTHQQLEVMQETLRYEKERLRVAACPNLRPLPPRVNYGQFVEIGLENIGDLADRVSIDVPAKYLPRVKSTKILNAERLSFKLHGVEDIITDNLILPFQVYFYDKHNNLYAQDFCWNCQKVKNGIVEEVNPPYLVNSCG